MVPFVRAADVFDRGEGEPEEGRVKKGGETARPQSDGERYRFFAAFFFPPLAFFAMLFNPPFRG
jgi:hypothetical protein